MANYIDNFIKYISSSEISFTRKTRTLIIAIIGLIVLSDIFNFSFNYRMNNKIEQLNLVYTIANNNDIVLDSTGKTIKGLKDEILSRKPITLTIINNIGNPLNIKLTNNHKTILLRLASGFSVFIILAIWFPFVEEKSELKAIYLGLFLMALLVNLLLLLIPKFANIAWNHIINVAISLALLFIIGYLNRGDEESV